MITVVAISSEQDFEAFDEWVNHLPSNVNKIVVKTVKGGTSHLLYTQGNLKVYEWGYQKFRFDQARNYALSKAETDWVIMLDMDERLQIFDKDILGINSLPQDVYGGMVKISSFTGQGDCGTTHEAIRVVRKQVKYSYHCHETAHKWIHENGYRLTALPLIIRHDSYVGTDNMLSKLDRNFHLILDNIEENKANREDPKLVGDLLRTLKGFEHFGTTD